MYTQTTNELKVMLVTKTQEFFYEKFDPRNPYGFLIDRPQGKTKRRKKLLGFVCVHKRYQSFYPRFVYIVNEKLREQVRFGLGFPSPL